MSPVGRRAFLGGAAASGAVGFAGGLGLAHAADAVGWTGRRSWFGPTQPGVAEPARAQVALLAFDVVAGDRRTLAETLRSLGDEARRIVDGLGYERLDPAYPPADTGLLGEGGTIGTTVTVSVGASLFDDRFGLADRRPAELVTMPFLANDRLDPARSHGDLLLQVSGDSPDQVTHAVRQLMRATRDGLVLHWMLEGFNRPDPEHVAGRTDNRNLLGFKDGTANPDPADGDEMARFVWIGPDRNNGTEPEWTVGGSYQVARQIRMLVERWDRVSLDRQEQIFGRTKTVGAPLGMHEETDEPDYGGDPQGAGIPLDAHIRLARPRTPDTEHQRIYRKGFNYSLGFDASGTLDQGLAFVSYQRSLSSFVAIQDRLTGEPLEEYVRGVGGGYFFVLPGVRGADDWLGRPLLG